MLTMSGISFPIFLVLLELASPLESRGEERIHLAKPSKRSYQDNLLNHVSVFMAAMSSSPSSSSSSSSSTTHN